MTPNIKEIRAYQREFPLLSRGEMPDTAERAQYLEKKGFVCSNGNHVLYCPDLTKADKTQPFYLHCPKHDLTFQIDLMTQGDEFIAHFPHGCREK